MDRPVTAPSATVATPPQGGGRSWWFPLVPRNRIAVLRVVAYLFALADVLWITTFVEVHGRLAGALYTPLRIGRILPFPVPTEMVVAATKWGLVVAALVALSGRAPRLSGAIVAGLYFEWMLIAMSYGKVDHDRFGFLVLLFLLPTVGRIGFRDRTLDPAAGWVLRMVQIGVVATYVLAAMAKVRFGGWEWVNSATLQRAVVKRGTDFGDWFGEHPELLHGFQYVMLIAEFAAVLLLIDGRWRRWAIYLAFLFHLGTLAAISIAFYPHLIAMLAFLETERVIGLLDRARSRIAPKRRTTLSSA